MTFSKEDRAAWEDSKIMKELEKFADEILHPSNKAYEPIEEVRKDWEEENLTDEEKLVDAAEQLLKENSFEEELRIAYNNQLIYKLEKLAEDLADKSNTKAAYRIERTIQELKALMREDYNAKY